jgi:hypothetical protein
MDLKEEEILGGKVESHWYYASKAAAMQAYLDKDHYAHVLDVGAGSGFFTKHLLKAGAAKRGTSRRSRAARSISCAPIRKRMPI